MMQGESNRCFFANMTLELNNLKTDSFLVVLLSCSSGMFSNINQCVFKVKCQDLDHISFSL